MLARGRYRHPVGSAAPASRTGIVQIVRRAEAFHIPRLQRGCRPASGARGPAGAKARHAPHSESRHRRRSGVATLAASDDRASIAGQALAASGGYATVEHGIR